MLRKIALVALSAISITANAQRVPDRDVCINYTNQATSYVNQSVGVLVDLKQKGIIDYEYFVMWQNFILRQTEYKLFKLKQQTYSPNNSVCMFLYHEVTETTDAILRRALLDHHSN